MADRLVLDAALCRAAATFVPPLYASERCEGLACRVMPEWTLPRGAGKKRLCTKHCARTIRRDRRRGGGRRG